MSKTLTKTWYFLSFNNRGLWAAQFTLTNRRRALAGIQVSLLANLLLAARPLQQTHCAAAQQGQLLAQPGQLMAAAITSARSLDYKLIIVMKTTAGV